ncbi:MAG: DUF5640 domain-containing protein [Candidatus Nanoarchaeia archaeon]|nr:DUF5640 domain-containing protein [Clostridiales bacterium]MDD3264284.1 DUF5640 domain-containing protein [Candidatus Nanoarchaeia archaeon]MDD3540630.1 DUF5640 domain-containing protein [Eubacteriales bacterium]NLG30727.1 hypothetical protein [Clostridiaceae bacterium]
MRKTKSIMLVLATVMALMIVLSMTACGGGGGGGGDELKGTWTGRSEDMEVTWIFDGKGGCKMENEFGFKDEGTYELSGNAITIDLSKWDEALGYTYKIDGSHMSLVADESIRPSYELDKK